MGIKGNKMPNSWSAADKAEIALQIVRECPDPIAYDTETSGVDWKRNFPIGYVVTDGGERTDERVSVYVPIRHGGGGNLPHPNYNKPAPQSPTDDYSYHPFELELREAFQERERKGWATIGHNLKFDCHFSANTGVMLGRNICCTQNREALIDENARGFGLEASATRHNVTAKKAEPMYEHLAQIFGVPKNREIMSHYWRTSGDDPVAVDYAESDGASTIELFHAQQKIIDRDELGRVDKLERELIWTLFRMERRGIAVDTEYLHQTQKSIEERLEEIKSKLPKDFNPRAPTQVKAFLGRDDYPTTDKGNPSFTEKWLKTFPEGQLIVDLRKWTNITNTFIGPLLEKHTVNGRVHATLNQLKSDNYGTIARLSCSDPNLQQIPKHDKDLAPLFRAGFVADPDMLFCEADYSQCEPRLFAHYSEEPALIEGYNADPPRDVHQVVADLFDCERDPTAKRMNMGIFTGMYPKTFAGHMGWSLEEATEAWNNWFKHFPKIRDFQDLAKRAMKQRGYVRTLLGRRGRLDHPRFAYKATSKIIQGGNADIIKHKLVEIDKYFESLDDAAYLQMSVHDSINWGVPNTLNGRHTSEEVVRIMEDVQSEPFNLNVPFTVDYNAGRNWKEATFGVN